MRSISRSASPELTPCAAEPLIDADRNRLKWLMTCGAVVSFMRHDLLERHHLARPASARRAARSACGLERKLLIGLDVDAIGAVVELEVVHVLRPEEDLQRARDLAERQPQRQRALPVDRHLQLRIVGGERAEERRPQQRRLRCRRRRPPASPAASRVMSPPL